MSKLLPVFRELVRLETELWNALDVRLQTDMGLSLARFEPMHVITGLEGCRVQEIADALSITVGGTSKLVDRIEAAGFCRRRPHPADGRSSILELTASGNLAHARAVEIIEKELQRTIGAAATNRSWADLHATLTAIRRALRGTAPSP